MLKQYPESTISVEYFSTGNRHTKPYAAMLCTVCNAQWTMNAESKEHALNEAMERHTKSQCLAWSKE